MKKLFIYILTLLCVVANLQITNVRALYTYYVKAVNPDGTYTTVLETTSLTEAKNYYANVNTDVNYALFQDDTIVSVLYGVVVFKRTSACDYNVEYTNAITNGSGYTNGCYGADGLFLDTNSDFTQFKFMQSNAVGWGKRKDLTIYPIEAVHNVTNYRVTDGRLYHQIKTNMDYEPYGAFIDLGTAPSSLTEGESYYSYDGKYFYTSFEDMRNDVIVYSHEHAVNQEPYYNYYQYVTNRTTTNYTNSELDNYLKNYVKLNSRLTEYLDTNNDYISEILTQSQYYDNSDAFVQYQYEYGANALLMLAISMNETAMGRSSLSYTRNNMFGHNAYDNNVEANASRYRSVSSSISYHAKVFISNNYSNPAKFQYHGSYLGDKGSGMNVSYASDPYWGEKAAQYYMRIDEAMGSKDYNSYALGIKSTATSIPIYSLPSPYSTVLYYTGNNWDYSFVLLDKTTINDVEFYKVQIDPALDEYRNSTGVYYYDFKKAVGYVRTSDINYVLNEAAIKENDYTTITYLGDGGTFLNGEESLTITYRSNDDFDVELPIKNEYVFDKWVELDAATRKATYKHVTTAWISGNYKTTYYQNQSINLNDMTLNIMYDDGSKETVSVTTDMLSKIRLTELGANEITVAYQGASTNMTLYVEERDTAVQDVISDNLTLLIDSKESLTDEMVTNLKTYLDDVKYHNISLGYDDIRKIDTLLKEHYSDLQVIINDERFDLGLSGLSIILNKQEIEKGLFPINMYINVNEASEELDSTFRQVTLGNNWHYYDSFSLEMLLGKEAVDASGNYIVSLKTMDNDTSKYYVIMAEKDGEVYRLYGTQTNSRIIFNTRGYTNFALAYLTTTNDYSKADINEIYTVSTNGYNVVNRVLLITSGFIIVMLLIIGIITTFLYRSNPTRMRERQRLERIKKEQELELKKPRTTFRDVVEHPVDSPTKVITKINVFNDEVVKSESTAPDVSSTQASLSAAVREIMNDEALRQANEEYRKIQEENNE